MKDSIIMCRRAPAILQLHSREPAIILSRWSIMLISNSLLMLWKSNAIVFVQRPKLNEIFIIWPFLHRLDKTAAYCFGLSPKMHDEHRTRKVNGQL